MRLFLREDSKLRTECKCNFATFSSNSFRNRYTLFLLASVSFHFLNTSSCASTRFVKEHDTTKATTFRIRPEPLRCSTNRAKHQLTSRLRWAKMRDWFHRHRWRKAWSPQQDPQRSRRAGAWISVPPEQGKQLHLKRKSQHLGELVVGTNIGEHDNVVSVSALYCWLNNTVVHKLNEAAIELTSVLDAA